MSFRMLWFLLESVPSQLHHHHLLLSCIGGFLCFYFLEYAMPHPTTQIDQAHYRHRHQAGVLGATGIGVHSYFDGFVIGQAFQAGEQMGFVVGSTVVLHKLTDGISTVGIMLGTHQSMKSTTGMLAMVAIAPLIGVGTQGFFVLPLPILALLLAWFAGGFLYLGPAAFCPLLMMAANLNGCHSLLCSELYLFTEFICWLSNSRPARSAQEKYSNRLNAIAISGSMGQS